MDRGCHLRYYNILSTASPQNQPKFATAPKSSEWLAFSTACWPNQNGLLGEKCAYADLAFTMWNMQIAFFMGSRTGEHAWNPDKFPHFTKWQNACLSRDSVKKVLSVLREQEVQSS